MLKFILYFFCHILPFFSSTSLCLKNREVPKPIEVWNLIFSKFHICSFIFFINYHISMAKTPCHFRLPPPLWLPADAAASPPPNQLLEAGWQRCNERRRYRDFLGLDADLTNHFIGISWDFRQSTCQTLPGFLKWMPKIPWVSILKWSSLMTCHGFGLPPILGNTNPPTIPSQLPGSQVTGQVDRRLTAKAKPAR